MIRGLIVFICIVRSLSAIAQQENRSADTTQVLDEVTIEAFQYDRPLSEVPASIGLLQTKELERFSNTSLLSAINTVPGVRMEERSPGSYRLAIRGSSLRSPFGVRNVKVYWNGLPFTDAGGNTYLNLLDQNSFQQAEIIKGPGTSLYGAGTGGVLLLKNSPVKSGIDVSAMAGSYGLMRYTMQAKSHSDQSNIQVLYAHQQSDGYRQQTKMARDVVQTQADFLVNEKGTLSANILYADLYYQTPGALTKQQYQTDPRQARPTAGPNPGAIEQKAAVYNKTFYSGLSYDYQWNDRWSNTTGVYGSFTQFDNPAIRNVEKRVEQGMGARTNTQYIFPKGKLNFGAEYQRSFSPVKVYDNNQGQSGAMQTDDEISINTYFGFAQAEFYLPANFFLTAGASINKLDVNDIKLSDTPPRNASNNFDLVFSPRIALLNKISPYISIHASYSQGYSPPTSQELFPSTGQFNPDLKPEQGKNSEIGIRGLLFNTTFTYDVVVYNFQLNETIVTRRLDDGAEYFVNAGKTQQRGAEIQLGWSPHLSPQSFLSNLKVWTSFTYNDYTFKNYAKDTTNYSGNKLTGIAPHIVVAGLDLNIQTGLYTNITFTYTDRIPVNDANTDYANDYFLLGARAGYKKQWQRLSLDIFGGVDNALNAKYSLGNDLNAALGRYYNAAPGINYYAGLKTGLSL
ncbi:TonB-dependent receptor [Ohtaekwangia sp.]|uniref:TonB-dependent receptor n=1 Tax=Ohtaekwangia sp. TaxID=2066019 RepID=UPI002FDCF7D1